MISRLYPACFLKGRDVYKDMRKKAELSTFCFQGNFKKSAMTIVVSPFEPFMRKDLT